MDMSMTTSMTMGVPSAMATTVSASSSATMPAAMDMGGGDCKTSTLWNWYTIDSCFIASSWHIRSDGMFAGSCIGVILLVMILELLRRAGKEYDRYIIRQATSNLKRQHRPSGKSVDKINEDADVSPPRAGATGNARSSSGRLRPSLLQQTVRATIFMLQFTVAYFIMLLAMYYNGYIIICIIIGAFLGSFVFNWEILGSG